MKLVMLDPYNREHQNIIDKSSKKQIFQNFMSVSSVCSKEEYEEIKNKRNEITEYLLDVDNEKIKNFCIFTGTKDNRLIQIGMENLTEKKFFRRIYKLCISSFECLYYYDFFRYRWFNFRKNGI